MARKPHIVIFNPDQWRGDVAGYAGNDIAVTPNLDRLARTDGVAFSQAYCQNPVCTPSRCSFMSGWYPHVRGHRTMHYMMRPDEPVLLRTLKEQGYFVWWGGKNDLVPGQHGFDEYCDVKFAPTADDWRRWGRTPAASTHSATEWRGERGSDTYYGFLAGRLGGDDGSTFGGWDWGNVLGAIDLIRNGWGDQPLCLYLPLGNPHPPYGVEEPWYSMIDRSALPPRTPAPESWDAKPSILRGIYDGQGLGDWPEERWNELRAVYYGMCAKVDHQFGMVMDALREAGIYDDTAVFSFSDHGDFTGDYGIVEKTQNTFEDCLTRVPLVIKPPAGVPCQPRTSDALVELIDFPATVLEMTGIEPDWSHFGLSLTTLLAGETHEHRDAVFCEGGRLIGEVQASEIESTKEMEDPTVSLYWPRQKMQINEGPAHTKATMCRTRRYKYVRRLYESDELYDLEQDPRELDNRIDDPALAGVLAEMKERMLRWYQTTADVVPFDTDVR